MSVSRPIFTSLALATLASAMAPAASVRAVDELPEGWRELGPAPYVDGYVFEGSGRISAIAPHPTRAGVSYLGAATGGVWRCEGSECAIKTSGLPSASIGAITIDPHDPQVLYAGSGEPTYRRASYYGAGIYKSVDGGETWSLHARDRFGGRTVSRILVSPDDPEIVWASVMRPGRSNSHPGAEDPEVGVFRSIDGGERWSRVIGLPAIVASDIVVDPSDSQTMYVGLASLDDSGGIYKSVDGGESWSELRGGLAERLGVIEFAISPSMPSRVYTITSVNGRPIVYRSDDAGDSWSRASPDGLSNYEWYAVAVAVDPQDPDVVMVGGIQIYRSTDAGRSYRRVTAIHPDTQALVFDAGGQLLAGTDGGLHSTRDLGSTWESINQGLGVIQFYPFFGRVPGNPDYFVGGTQDNGTMRRKNGRWTMVLNADGGTTAIHPDAPNVVFAEIYGTGSLYRSRDGGDSFNKVGGSISGRTPWMAAYTIDPSDPQTLYYGTQRLYKSSDQGGRWSAISSDLTGGGDASITSIAVAPGDPRVIWVSTTDGRLSVSRDGGETFEVKIPDMRGPWSAWDHIEISEWNPDTVLVAVPHFGTDQIRRTDDGGDTWRVLDGDLPDIPVNALQLLRPEGNREVLVAGTDRGVHIACDMPGRDDMRWAKIEGPIDDAHVLGIAYEPENDSLVFLTFGRGAWAFEQATPEWLFEQCEVDDDDDDGTGETGEDSAETGEEGMESTDASDAESESADASSVDAGENTGSGGDEGSETGGTEADESSSGEDEESSDDGPESGTEGDGDASGDPDDTGADAAGDEDPGDSAADADESGLGGSSGDESGLAAADDGGCGCRGSTSSMPGWAWILLLAGGGVARRRPKFRPFS